MVGLGAGSWDRAGKLGGEREMGAGRWAGLPPGTAE